MAWSSMRRCSRESCSRSSAPGCRAVLQHRVQRDAVVRLRQVFADRGDGHAVVEQLAVDAMMLGAPGHAAGRHAVDAPSRTGRRRGRTRRSSRAGSRGTGRSRRTLAPERSRRSAIAVDLARRNSPDDWHTDGTSDSADQVVAVRQAVGKRVDFEFSSRRGVPIPLQATTTTCGRLELLDAVRVEVDDARRPCRPASAVISRTRQRGCAVRRRRGSPRGQ